MGRKMTPFRQKHFLHPDHFFWTFSKSSVSFFKCFIWEKESTRMYLWSLCLSGKAITMVSKVESFFPGFSVKPWFLPCSVFCLPEPWQDLSHHFDIREFTNQLICTKCKYWIFLYWLFFYMTIDSFNWGELRRLNNIFVITDLVK